MRTLGCARRWRLALVVGCLPLVGCASANPFTLRKENMALKQSLSQLQTQNAQAQNRNKVLDADNKQLASRLAQEQQQEEQLRSELAQTRSQAETSARVASAPAHTEVGSRSANMSRRRGSSDGWLAMVDISGAEVQREGDQVRIRITNSQLFDPGSAKLKPGASRVLDRVARAVRDTYPGMMIGVQGHTDADPIRRTKAQWKDNHELSVQRALAVYEYLKAKGALASDRLYVAGYGPNVPVASNRTSNGKAQNRRVDIVVSAPEHSVARGESYRD